MDKLLQYRQGALKNVQMASYLLSTTYPLIKEPKTLLMISDHVFSSLMSSVSQILFFERSKRTIPPYHETDESKINSFRQYLVKKYKFEGSTKTSNFEKLPLVVINGVYYYDLREIKYDPKQELAHQINNYLTTQESEEQSINSGAE